MHIIENATIQTEDSYGPKVYQLENGDYLKLFRTKRQLTFKRYYPLVARFTYNAKQLTKHGIKTIKCRGSFTISSFARHAVIYEPLKGKLLRDLSPEVFPMKTFATFFSTLHEKGIYFRSCHLANILYTEEQECGLIDIADLQFKSMPLTWKKRFRNFKHLLRYDEDRKLLALDEQTHFWESYFSNTSLAPLKQQQLQAMVRKYVS